MKQNYLISVIDGQGGGIGRQIVERLLPLKQEFPTLHIRVLGTNALATNAMLKAGADDGATGENAVIRNALRSTIIMGVVPIIMPNAILGELTPSMAEAIGESTALKILIPMKRCNIAIAIPGNDTLSQYLDYAILMVREQLQKEDISCC